LDPPPPAPRAAAGIQVHELDKEAPVESRKFFKNFRRMSITFSIFAPRENREVIGPSAALSGPRQNVQTSVPAETVTLHQEVSAAR
jgi:hypothetical protein